MVDESGAPRAPSGTHDVLWPESTRWESLLAAFATRVEAAGYGLAHTPIFEDVRVFRRGIGEGSDVVGKEMYEFEDRGGRSLALRPEGTAPLVRAFVQHRPPIPWKAWYATAFRYERPQAGRYRQHHQLGVEALGSEDADLDVEVIGLADSFFRSLGLASFGLRINSMGDGVCRPDYLELLRAYLAEHDPECAEPLVAVVPVSVRRRAEQGALGNRLSAMFVPLANDLSEPLARLHAVAAACASAKAQDRADEARVAAEQFARAREPDDPTSHDGNVIDHKEYSRKRSPLALRLGQHIFPCPERKT